jgi:hypothetical protein
VSLPFLAYPCLGFASGKGGVRSDGADDQI